MKQMLTSIRPPASGASEVIGISLTNFGIVLLDSDKNDYIMEEDTLCRTSRWVLLEDGDFMLLFPTWMEPLDIRNT